jgi:1-acyl-sn-glycerol-3-phosphate acyltransferase
MNRLPLSDQLPYKFYPPRLQPICLWLARRMARKMVHDHQWVEEIDFAGIDAIRPLLGRGDGVLIAPNHTDHADSYMMFELSRRVSLPFYYMAAYQIFQGRNQWFLPRIGVFPVDREGSDLTAFKTGVDILARGTHPLFPEGEIYHLGDRVTPLREGALALAATAAKRLAEKGKTVWAVPVGIKYRYLDSHDPTPALHDLMDELERRASWWVDRDRDLVERIYHFAVGMLHLKEYEYLGEPQRGALTERIVALREHILRGVACRRMPEGKRRTACAALDVPERVKELRRACLVALADSKTTPDQAAALRKDLHDLFVAVQSYCYPGDYVRQCPTLERIAETLAKFEEDFLGVYEVRPRGPRRAVIRIGTPIDVGARLSAAGKPRLAVPALTTALEGQIQSLLDIIGPGRPLPGMNRRAIVESVPQSSSAYASSSGE